MNIDIPDLLRHRAARKGSEGKRWLAELPELLATIAQDWQLQIIAQLNGGTESLVFHVEQATDSLVLKLGIPDSLTGEVRTLQLAQGRGYAQLVDWQAPRGAMLLERLGGQLAGSDLPLHRQIEILCDTLKTAWRPVDDPQGLVTGAAKVRQQAAFIRSQWQALDHPCTILMLDKVLGYADQREAAFSVDGSCLVHGDAHIWNTLADPHRSGSYRFADPDGLYAEPALDLAISLREWRDELLDGDALENGLNRCRLLSDLTGIDATAIWQWGCIEHLSCGLLDLQLHDKPAAAQHFAILTRWLNV